MHVNFGRSGSAGEGPFDVGITGQGGTASAPVSGRALYAYPHEHYAFWRTVRAQARVAAWGDELPPGAFGEQLTLEGIEENALWIGDRLRLPRCVLAVSGPRFPGDEVNAAMGFSHAVKLMLQSGYCGAYLGVIEPGQVQAGDAIALIPGPREVNLRELFRARAGLV